MLAELMEEGTYRYLKRKVEGVDAADEDQIQGLVETMVEEREIGNISDDMHRKLCELLAEKTVPPEYLC